MLSKHLSFLVMLLLGSIISVQFAGATTISGHVYDLELNELSNVIISVNTTPHQQIISRNGTYELTLPKGTYYLEATQYDVRTPIAATQENVTISQEGIFSLDLILFPILEEIDEFPAIESVDDQTSTPFQNYALIAAGGIACLWIIIWFFHRTKSTKKKVVGTKEENNMKGDKGDPVLEQVLSIIRKHEGRISQRDLRKELPWSEAKMSIVITELQAQGKIQKYKRGRSNSIVIKK